MTVTSHPVDAPPSRPGDARRRSVASRMLSGLGWRGAFAAVSLVGGFGATVLAARVVGASEFATYVVAMSAFIIAPPLVQLGIGANTVRRVAELRAKDKHEEALAYGRKSLAISAGLGSIGSIAVAALLLITHPSHALSVFTALAITLWLETFRLCASYILLAHERQGWAAFTSYSSRVGATALLLVALLAASIHTNLAVVLWMMVIIQAVLAAVGLMAVGPYVATAVKGPPLLELIADGLPCMVVDAGNYLVGRADVWIAAAVFASRTESASYGAASTLAAQLTLPVLLVAMIVSPIIRSLWIERRLDELDAMLRTVATATTAVAVVGAIVFGLGAGTILRVVYLPSFARAASAMAVLGIGSVAAVVTGLSGEALIMCVSLRLAAFVTAMWAVASVGMLWIGARYGGLFGLAVASSAATVGLSATQVLIVWRRSGLVTLPALRVRHRAASLRENHVGGVT